MSRARYKYAGALAVLLAVLVLSVGVSTFLAYRTISQSESRWCSTLSLLTSRPVPKPAPNEPARLENYEFYLDLVQLRHDYGCRVSRLPLL